MRLEGVIVCVNMADYASETIPLNLRHFDHLVVVTAPEDVETQRICRYYDVQHVQTDVFRSRWGEFHKAAGINKGLAALQRNDWCLHMDADIVLPPRTRDLIERANLDKGKLYGCDRFNVPGYDAWRQHQVMPALQQDNYHVNLDIFPLAPRFSGGRMGGYAPPGYFQLWNAGARDLRYPEEHSDASRTDVLFTANWFRSGREMLPEFVAYHLAAAQETQGTDWGGRVSRRWGPQPNYDHHHPFHHRDPPHHSDHHHHDGHWHHHPDHHHHHPCPPPWPYGEGPEQEQE